MRQRIENGGLTVSAIAGNHAVFLGFDLTDEARDGCLGFAVRREDLTDHTSRWLSGFKTFKSQVPAPALTAIYQTEAQPIQSMWWGDYTAKPGHQYRYTVLPRYGTPAALTSKDSVSATVELTTDDPGTGTHGIYFNRGVAASQAYAARFGDAPDNLPPDKRAEAMIWLSRGLHEALIAFIEDGASAALAIRAAVYELTEPSVLAAFARAHAAGADVRIVYHADGDQGELNETAIQDAVQASNLDRSILIPRTHAVIAHNKFIVRAGRDGAGTLSPAQVWTGSTNLSQGGIFGHSNVGHVVRDPEVAQRFLEYWTELSADPARHALQGWADAHSPFDADTLATGGNHSLFSPRTALDPLDWYAAGFAASTSSTHITLPFGLDDAHFEAQLASAHTPGVLRFVLLNKPDNHQRIWSADPMVQVAVGALGTPESLGGWATEHLTGFNPHVPYLHTKVLLIGPLGPAPVTVSGSANFSTASTTSNDENMLVITGDTEVADVYFTEFNRIFDHFYARWWAHRLHQNAPDAHDYLTEDASWQQPYFKSGSPKNARRILYSGTGFVDTPEGGGLEMQITVTKTGGLAGVQQQLGPVEISSLDSEVADQVDRIVTELDFFNLPESLPGEPVPDGFSYAVQVVDGDRDHTVNTGGESNDPAVIGLHELITLLDEAVGFEDLPIVVNTPDGVVETRDWSAWYNRMPGTEDPDLHVSGICGLASSNITVRLEPGNVGVVPEQDLCALQLVVTKPSIGDGRYVELEVTWQGDVGPAIERVRISGVSDEIPVRIVE